MERRTPEDRAGELRRRLRDAGVPPETAAELFAIAFPPERTPGELLTIGEVEDWHGRLHEAIVPGDVVDAWNEAKGALLGLVIALAGSVRADELGVTTPAEAVEVIVAHVEQTRHAGVYPSGDVILAVARQVQPHGGKPAGVIEPVTYGELQPGDLFDPNNRGLAFARLVEHVEQHDPENPTMAIVTCTDGYAAHVVSSWPARPQPVRARKPAEPELLDLLELVDADDDALAGVWPRDVERARKASCTCDQLDPRAIQGGANCDSCHAADQVLQRIAAEVRS